MTGDDHAPQLDAVDFDPFAGPAIALAVPSTEPQREIWTAVQLGQDASLAFNESNSLRLRGALDVEALRAALHDVVARHESLRATFSADGLTLLVAPEPALDVPLVDLSALPHGERDERLAQILAREVETPFDLERGPLFRAQIVKLGGDDHQVIFTGHHIVVDGWSTAVLVGDWAKLYSARVAGRPAALPEPARFSAYAREQAARQGSPEQAAAEAYWVQQYAVGSIPVVDLPGDRPRPPLKTWNSRRVDHVLEAGLARDLRRAGAKLGASYFVTLLSGFVALLHRLTGLDDLVVGIPAAGQSQGEHGALVGHCVNTLALRARALPDEPFRALLQRLRKGVLDAFEHQDLTFGALLRRLPITRDPSRQPLVSIVFNVDNALSAEALAFAGLQAEFRANPRHFESFDLFVNAVDTGAECVLECQYNTDLLDGDSLRRVLRCFDVLLRAAADDPSVTLLRLPLLTEADRGQVVTAFNATDTSYAERGALHRLFEAQVERTPEAVATTFEGASLPYRELNARANRLARELRRRGVGRETRVGVCLERSHELVVALLAVLKAGGAYVPLDPDYPQERLAFMLQDSRAALLLTQPELLERLPAAGSERLLLTPALTGDPGVEASNLPGEVRDDQLAYVIYTSGSTGLPKGAMNAHGAVRNRLAWMQASYGLRGDDVVLQKTPFSFDVSVWEFFWTLLYGARLVVARPGGHRDPAYLVRTIREQGVTTLHFVPSMLQVFLEEAGVESCTALRRVVCSGEALPAPVVERFFTRLPCELHNLYGPTEAAVDVSAWECRRGDRRALVPIGRPIANTRLYALDARLEPSPLGVPGEIFIGGVQVARGYLERPALTAERFVPDPFSPTPGARLYRTGDLGRFLPDGALEFLGRLDHQVKLRGFRIELGEIEAALGAHPAVGACVVVAREDVPGDKRLVAYFAAREGQAAPDPAALTALLAERLPEYMVPSTFVPLPALPLGPSGKIDRKALPAPVVARAAEAYVAPHTPAQKLVAELWQEALHVGRVGLHDHFFKLGGHSLLAAQVLARLNREQQLVLPFRSLFEASTVERFAALVERAQGGAAAPVERIPHVARQQPARASLMQERLLLLEELDPDRRLVNNVPSAFHLRGRLDVGALRAALETFVARHEALRTTFRRDERGFVQVVGAPYELPLEPQDLSALPAAERDAALRARLAAITREGFDFERGPLFRAFLFQLAEDEHVFFTLRHNAVWDGWSFDLLRHELSSLYVQHTGGAPALLAEPAITYSDFAEWHRAYVQGEEVQRQLAFWRAKLQGWPAPLELPSDRPRPPARGYAGADEWTLIPRDEADRLTALAREHDATLFMLLLAAFDALLWRYSGQTDLPVATPVRARNRPETEDVVGLFTNTLMLRTTVDPQASFVALLARVRADVLDAFQHQDVPFDLLAQDAPPMRALFSMQEARHRATRLGDVELSLPHVLPPAAAVDVNFWLVELHDGLAGALNYSTELFERATIVRLLGHYRGLLRAIVRDAHLPLARLTFGDEAGATSVAAPDVTPAARRLSDAVAAHATARPDDVALVHGTRRLTWSGLLAAANGVAGQLGATGHGAGTRLALAIADPLEALVALVGTWRAGAAALPLEPHDPPARRAATLRALPVDAAVLDDDAAEDLDDALGGDVRRLAWRELRAAAPAAPQLAAPAPTEVALLLVVPAADGEPVGLEWTHAGQAHLLEGAVARLGLGAQDVVALRADAGWAERLLPLVAGARVVLLSDDDDASGEDLSRALRACAATAFAAPRATWRQLAAADFAPGEGFRALFVDTLPAELASTLRPRVGALWSLWGVEEAGLLANLERVDVPPARETLGAPLPGVRFVVLDERGEPLPDGIPGELALGGPGLACGAAGAATSGFALEQRSSRRVALSGWRARRLDDGRVQLLERRDERLHLRGRRGAAGELRAALLGCPGVAEAEVGLRDDGRGAERLVAWFVRRPGSDFTDSELRRQLRRGLPEAFVPQRFVELDALPRGATGGIDARRLPSPFRVRAAERPPRSDEERLLVELWREALGLAQVGVGDNFFDLGGHSLLSLQVVARVEARTGRRLKPRLLLLGSLEQAAAELQRLNAEPR